ncbi:hypothetical protein M0R45_019872 [Rubus argutus]|uniref:Uncharacterized protein n=1 Tax=Rubus argutus TaxID=59490 RepID=A0AAW1X8T2_RUBAR
MVSCSQNLYFRSQFVHEFSPLMGYLHVLGVEIPESVVNLTSKSGSLARKGAEILVRDQAEMAREWCQIATKAGCDLGLKWLETFDEEEKHLLTGNEMVEHA